MSLNLGIIASSRTMASVPLLLDTYTGAAAAYSVRKLNSAYTGFCMRVRRVLDGVDMDIGFDSSGFIDTTTLLTFIGSSSGIAYIWYDQTGNGRNATSGTDTSAPRIVVNGVLQTQLGKACVKYFTGNRTSGSRTLYNLVNPFSMIGVICQDAGFDLSARIFSSDNTANLLTIGRVNVTSVYTNGVVCNFPSKVLGQTYLVSFMRQTTSNYVHQNGSSVTNSSTLSNNWGPFAIGASQGNNESVDSRVSEVILYPNNQLSNISGINSNINSYYSIY